MYVNESLLDDSDFEPPSANPAIQLEYEAALGSFVVAYNALDQRVGKVLAYALGMLGRAQLAHLPRQFAGQVDLLDILGATKLLGLGAIDYEEIRNINRMRNFLVHGFFDQNPYDGSYIVVGKRRDEHVKAGTIRVWRDRAVNACDALRGPEAAFMFGHIKIPDVK